MNNDHSIGICNPLLNEYVLLPVSDLQRKIKHGSMFTGFGYHPIIDEYKVVRIKYRWTEENEYIGDVEVYTLGKGNGMWRYIGTIKNMLWGLPVLVNGSLHWLSMPRQIVSFDLKVEEFHVTPVPLPPHSPCGMLAMELKELKGCLSFVCSREEEEMVIWVLKDYMNKESWVKEFSITREERTCDCSPCAIMKNKNGDHDQLLLWWNSVKFVSYDPKNPTVEDVVGGTQRDHVVKNRSTQRDHVVQEPGPVLHIDSLISLKALGEDPDLYRKSSRNINSGHGKGAKSWKRKRETFQGTGT